MHKKECRYLKNYSPKVPTESIKLFLRLLLKHQVGVQYLWLDVCVNSLVFESKDCSD